MNNYFLYLTKQDWVRTWENGGEVPINPASSYLADVQEGVMTPDEVDQRSLVNIPDWVTDQAIVVRPGAGRVSINDVQVVWGENHAYINRGSVTSYLEDGLIFCLSTKLDSNIAQKLKKEACVRIKCMCCLFEVLDTQLGPHHRCGPVRYTARKDRNHFLKSKSAEFMQEFRIFWKSDSGQKRDVVLPAGLAEQVYW